MEQFDWIMGLVVPYFNFFLFLGMAIYFFKKPLAGVFAKRRADYLSLFEEASQAKAEAEKQQRELKQKLADLEEELTKLRATSEEHARKEADAIIKSAESLAQNISEEAKKLAESEINAVMENLRNEIILTVKANVADRLGKELSTSDHQRLLTDRIKSVKSITNVSQGVGQ